MGWRGIAKATAIIWYLDVSQGYLAFSMIPVN